ncbi:MAG: glycosyltransferase [Candidatus Scalindua sp.]
MLRNMRLQGTATQETKEELEERLNKPPSSTITVTFRNPTDKGVGPVDVEAREWTAEEIKECGDPKITLCMIVKNEEAHVGRCLESVKGYVDEIVVVDTGSTDRTKEICLEHGAQVFEHPWEGSFSTARNQAMRHVNTEWILQLDADEIMEVESAPKIRDIVRSVHKSTANMCYLTLFNRDIDDSKAKDLTSINTGKIIRMGIGAHYVNRIHNKLVCDGDTRVTGLKILHYGYHLDAETMKMKHERTMTMLLAQLEDMPDDPDTHYYLTIQYLRGSEWDKCIEYSEKGVKLFLEKEPDSQLLLLVYNAGAIAYYHKKAEKPENKQDFLKKAEELCLKAVKIYPDYLDANSLLSSIYFATKEYDKCFEASKRFLQAAQMHKNDPTKALIIPINCLKNEWLVNIHLCINFYENAEGDNAVMFLKRSEDCLAQEEKYKPSWTMFKYMIQRGDQKSLQNAESIYKGGYRQE